MDLTYIIGEPGAGKSTLAAYLTAGLPYDEVEIPVPHLEYACGVIELGRRREGGFPGTDALSMSIQPKVLEWLGDRTPPFVFAEGDRLGNQSFLLAVRQLGYTVHLYQLWGAEVAARQRGERGSNQDPTWLKGRQSKVTAVRKMIGGVILPAGQPVANIAAKMTDPVTAKLRAREEMMVV